MYRATVTLTGINDYVFGKKVSSEKGSDETYDQHEQRTWKEKCNIDADGNLFISPFALKRALTDAGKWLSKSIPGEGKKTYTKRLTSGVLISDPLILTDHSGNVLGVDNIDPRPLWVPLGGETGGKKRGNRIFPTLAEWKTVATIDVLDSIIDEDTLMEHIEAAGMFIGFGSMRVENGGINGRFLASEFQTSEISMRSSA